MNFVMRDIQSLISAESNKIKIDFSASEGGK